MLDVIRAVSAMVVMAGHLRNALLPDFSQLTDPSLPLRLFYLISGLGHQAVIVFFVLSGYLVGGTIIKAGDQFKWRPYATSRISRMWTVLIPAITLTATLDFLLLNNNPNIFDQFHRESWHSTPSASQYSSSLWTGIQNLLFLQNITAPTFGTNGPLWSLANEAWYYVMYPCIFVVFRAQVNVQQKIIALIAFLGVATILPASTMALFPVWLLGTFLHSIRIIRFIRHWFFGFVAFAIFSGAAILARTGKIPMTDFFLADYLVGLSFTAWCLHLHQYNRNHSNSHITRFFHHVSEMSFSLYAIHMPIVFFLVGTFFPTRKLPADGQGILVFAAFFSMIVAASWIFWWIFERNTPIFRRKLNTWLGVA